MRKVLNAADEQLREKLAIRVNALIAESGLSQQEAGAKIGMPQSKVSQVSRLQLKNISVSKLIYALLALEQDVDIVIRPNPYRRPAVVRVAI